MRNLVAFGFPGTIHPVNPRYDTVMGLPCIPSVTDLDAPVDLALVAVKAELVLPTLERCASAGISHAIVYTAGFGELNAAGRDMERRIAAHIEATGMRVVGPNCQGILNARFGVCTSFATAFGGGSSHAPSGIAIASQSGAMGQVLFAMFEEAGLGLNYAISTGNELNVDITEMIGYCLEDPEVRVICGYVETLRDAARVQKVAERARELGKTILLVKGGRSEAGARAVASHTGSLAGSDAAYRALFDRVGIVYPESVEEMVVTTSLALSLTRGGRRMPRSPRTGIITNSGGLGVLATDDCIAHGLPVPALSAEGRATLDEIAPDFIDVGNPIDLADVARARPEAIGAVLEILHRVEGFNLFLVPILSIRDQDAMGIFSGMAVAQKSLGVPVVVAALSSEPGVAATATRLGLTVATDMERTIRALASLSRLAGNDPPDSHVVASADHRERRPEDGGAWLSEWASKVFLRERGLPVARGFLADDADAAVRAWRTLDGPVAVKASSPHLAHKSDIGCLRLNLDDETAVRVAFEDVREAFHEALPHACLDGVIVEEVLSGGMEMIVGLKHEPPLGDMVMVGAGGIYAEVFSDVSVGVLPLTRDDVVAMVRRLKVFPVLDGARGREPLDVDALVDLVMTLVSLAGDPTIPVAELDLNPVLVLPEGEGTRIVDATLVRREVSQPQQ